jgi:hypothetical protein
VRQKALAAKSFAALGLATEVTRRKHTQYRGGRLY